TDKAQWPIHSIRPHRAQRPSFVLLDVHPLPWILGTLIPACSGEAWDAERIRRYPALTKTPRRKPDSITSWADSGLIAGHAPEAPEAHRELRCIADNRVQGWFVRRTFPPL